MTGAAERADVVGTASPGAILSVRNLKTEFATRHGTLTSVDNVSFDVPQGRTVAVVGESGSGKSVTSLSIMRLVDRNGGNIAGGTIAFRCRDGRVIDLAQQRERAMRAIRGNQIAMIFQEPMASLDPIYGVGNQIAEAVAFHQNIPARRAFEVAVAMLREVGISSPETRAREFPHQMSGGMRQRVMIAMALSCKPSLLIADEPTTALDVTIQAQILQLIRRLQAEHAMSVLFITHNLGVVAEVADRVVVMYAGRVVEEGPVRDIFRDPRHPYTMGLLNSMPRTSNIGGVRTHRLAAIPGAPPTPRSRPPGCAFAPRCSYAVDACREAVPPQIAFAPERSSACIRWKDLRP